MSAVLLLVLLLLSLPDQAAARVKLAISALFIPLFGLSQSTQTATGKVADMALPRGVLLNQMEQLRQENEQLRVLQMQSEAMKLENDRLRQMFQMKPQKDWKPRLAKVVGRDPANWWQTVQIDLGSADGLKVNLPVMTSQGLVGRIYAVGQHRALVVLIGSAECRVAAIVDKSRENGVVGPSASAAILDPNLVELSYLTRNSKLEPGQPVYTSGLGGIFPAGILIGSIVDTQTVEHGLYVEARIKLAVNVNQLEEVWVLLSPGS
ncbi:MAG: rod shape-determining protein MreC [Verrucomicrobiota bacterium]